MNELQEHNVPEEHNENNKEKVPGLKLEQVTVPLNMWIKFRKLKSGQYIYEYKHQKLAGMLKKISPEEGDVIIAHNDLRLAFSTLKADFKVDVPVVYVDDIEQVQVDKDGQSK